VRLGGYERIEESYKNRLNKTGIDYNFKIAVMAFERHMKRQSMGYSDRFKKEIVN